MALVLNAAPGTEPLTLTEAKSHLRVTITDDDTLITSLIVAARRHAEDFLHRALITQTWELHLDRFPAGDDPIVVPLPPLQSISSIAYTDTNGDPQTVSGHQVDAKSEPGRIFPEYGEDWPDTRDIPNAVKVTFVAGYGAAASVPQALKQAILFLVAHLYENREPVNIGNIVNDIPLTVEALLWPQRVVSF